MSESGKAGTAGVLLQSIKCGADRLNARSVLRLIFRFSYQLRTYKNGYIASLGSKTSKAAQLLTKKHGQLGPQPLKPAVGWGATKSCSEALGIGVKMDRHCTREKKNLSQLQQDVTLRLKSCSVCSEPARVKRRGEGAGQLAAAV